MKTLERPYDRKEFLIDNVFGRFDYAVDTIVSRYSEITNIYNAAEEVADLLAYEINDALEQIENIDYDYYKTNTDEILTMFEDDIVDAIKNAIEKRINN